ncbi:LpqB family beta-propeller domain-containing protein [Nonomuraea sp. NPDC050556]|uniref:LpqB family beta-propeller domain-containing protein n=1 Tax=Nonomuraea sp. NPDC050556 TaxID=3364369 RepID=UPI0037B471DF
MRSRWLVVLLAAGLSSGCAVISSGGPTTELPKGPAAPLSKPYHRMIATSPQPGWVPTQVVQGLQAAMAAVDDPSWQVLKKYLTQEKQQTWKPNVPITVLDQVNIKESETPPNSPVKVVEISGKKVADLFEDGRYVPTQQQPFNTRLSLVKSGDSFRVSEVFDGLVLSEADLERAYRQTNLYYLNRARAADLVVPDPVWLRIDPKVDLVRTIVERLIKGPSAALAGAVHSAIPQGARLDSVKEVEERIVMDFAPGFHVDSQDEGALRAQLAGSLNDIAKGKTIEVTVGGEPSFTVNPQDAGAYTPDTPGQAYYVDGGVLYAEQDKDPGKPVEGPAGQKSDLYEDYAISQNQPFVAARGKSGGIWVAGTTVDARWEEWIKGADLTPPVWNRDGTLWTVNKSTSEVIVYRPKEQQHVITIAAPSLKSGVQQLKPARDGVRVAAVTLDSNGGHVSVGAYNGQMIGNFQPVLTVTPDQTIRSITWSDSTHLYVLVDLPKSGVAVKKIDLAEGTTESVTPQPDKNTKIIAASGNRLLAGVQDPNSVQGALLEWKDGKDWEQVKKITDIKGMPLFPSG